MHSREITNEQIKEMLLDKSSYHWREGMPHPKGDTILIRFATNSDKKITIKKPERRMNVENDTNINSSTKNPWGDLCKSWGVYDHQEIFRRKFPPTEGDQYDEPLEKIQIKNKKLAMRLGKRNHDVEDDKDSSSSDSEWKKKSKTPRMRMRADDEESKQGKCKRQTDLEQENESGFAPLSIEVVNSRSTFIPREEKMISHKFKYKDRNLKQSVKSIQSRLGTKVAQNQESSSDDSSDEADRHNTMSRVQKVPNPSKSSVWSRLEVNVAKNVNQNDLRQILSTRKNKTDDLRDKLSKSKQCNLRIEIDNNYADE